MKKGILMGAFALFGVIALSSCKKDYTCTCTDASGTVTTETHSGDSASEACADGSSVLTLKTCVPA